MATAADTARSHAILGEFERRKRAANLAVPTDDAQVQARLRQLKQPVIVFAEDRGTRRDRLRDILIDQEDARLARTAATDADGDIDLPDADEEADKKDDEDDDNEEFFTPGSDSLLRARKDIARYSIPRAAKRLRYLKEETKIPLKRHVEFRNEIKARLRGVELFGSQISGDRPISVTRFSPNGETIATGNWGGSVRLLDVPSMTVKHTFKGHADRIGGIGWMPNATLENADVSASTVNLVSGGGEGDVQLWSLDKEDPLAVLKGHTGRVCRTEFHPSGRYVGSASYDTTWRLWDVETQQESLLQEGHSKEVYCLAFQSDGSLVVSGGLDGFGRVWDLRSGRTIMLLEGHLKEIYGVDWSTEGYRVLTGSGDGLTICWDLRKVAEVAKIPTHSKGVTDLKWYQGFDHPMMQPDGEIIQASGQDIAMRKSGTFTVSCGFDKNVQLYSAGDWSPIKTLTGHTGNVLSCDVTKDGKWIVSGAYDRTVKLWARDDMSPF